MEAFLLLGKVRREGDQPSELTGPNDRITGKTRDALTQATQFIPEVGSYGCCDLGSILLPSNFAYTL